MSILYLHGWNSSVGGVKPSYSGLDEASALIITGHEHRLADPAALQALLAAVQRQMAGTLPSVGSSN